MFSLSNAVVFWATAADFIASQVVVVSKYCKNELFGLIWEFWNFIKLAGVCNLVWERAGVPLPGLEPALRLATRCFLIFSFMNIVESLFLSFLFSRTLLNRFFIFS